MNEWMNRCTGVAKYSEVGSGIFADLLWTVTNSSFEH